VENRSPSCGATLGGRQLPQEVPGRSAKDGKTMEHHRENIEKHMGYH